MQIIQNFQNGIPFIHHKRLYEKLIDLIPEKKTTKSKKKKKKQQKKTTKKKQQQHSYRDL